MEGPRAVQKDELASLSRLVDTVFRGRQDRWMFEQYPNFFREDNLANLLVYVDGDVVVSHVGMIYHWASLGGCTVRVACIGAVSTYESYRRRGLAGELFARARVKARADGADFMMISGGLPIYRRAGAADVGRDFKALVDGRTAETLADPQIRVREFDEGDLPACAAFYDRKPAHFIRAAEDWTSYLVSRTMVDGDKRVLVILRNEALCGYIVHTGADRDGALSVFEFAGEDTAIAGAIHGLMTMTGLPSVTLHVQSGDDFLLGILRQAGATFRPVCASGTFLIINFPQLMERLIPYFQRKAGLHAADGVRCTETEDRFTFEGHGQRVEVSDRVELAQRIFGRADAPVWDGALGRLFPVPALWYGLNYV